VVVIWLLLLFCGANEKGRSLWLRPLVLRFDSLFLLFQIGWGDLAGFCVARKRKYRKGEMAVSSKRLHHSPAGGRLMQTQQWGG
jgi:hypothetical protein